MADARPDADATSAAVNSFVSQHNGHLLDITARDGIVVVACNECCVADAFGTSSEEDRQRAISEHLKVVAGVLTEVANG